MSSNFHYPIDLNEDQNHQAFFCPLGSSSLHQASSSSSSSSSLSYLPFLINSHQEHVAYNTTHYHADHDHHLSQPLQAKMLMCNGGSSSCDHVVPKKETRLKLTIRKREERTDQKQTKGDESGSSPTNVKWMSSSKMRMMKKMIGNKQPLDQNLEQEEEEDDHSKNGYGNNNNGGVIRVCSDCNTTKTPLWRSGPRGPKSLCNACGIRQRKARRAAMVAAAAGDHHSPAAQQPQPQQHLVTAKKKNIQNNKNKKSSSQSNGGDYSTAPTSKAKKCKITSEEEPTAAAESETHQSKSSALSSSSSSNNNKLCFDDLTVILSKSSAFQQVFPQDEKEAAILLMALSYGMVHG